MDPSTSLEVALARLDRIIEDACTERNHLGVFPAMYRSVTQNVTHAVRRGDFFDDNELVEHMTVLFADLYFEAYHQYRSGEPLPQCWKVAFETAEQPKRRMLLQHLLLGMNAHINYDLGLATVAASGSDLSKIQVDFLRVNEILFLILDDLQGALGEVSPRMATLDRWGRTWDELVMRVGIKRCRDLAWSFACHLNEDQDRFERTAQRDADATWIARAMLRPWSPVNLAAGYVGRSESRDVPEIVDALSHRVVDLDQAERLTNDDLEGFVNSPGSDQSLFQAAHRHPTQRRHPRH